MFRKISLIFLILSVLESCGFVLGKENQKSSVSELLGLLGVGINSAVNQAGTTLTSGLTYAGSPYLLRQGSPINAITPTVTGSLTGCVASPSLPTGLSIDSLTCTISGTPTNATPTSTTYKITGSYSSGNTSVDISIQITSDGSGWTQRTLPSSQRWRSVAFGNGVFVAVAFGSNAAATSSDGITWTARTLPSSSDWSSVAFGNGVFVAVASGTVAATSSDGISWTARTLSSSRTWNAITFGSGKFVAIASPTGSNEAATSSDGITWTPGTATCPGVGCAGALTHGNSLFVAVGGSGGISASNGINWSSLTMPISGFTGVSFGNGVFVALSTSQDFTTSSDGINWTSRSNSNFSGSVKRLTFGNGIFLNLQVGTSNTFTSLDGVTWTQRTLPTSGEWSSGAYGNGVFVAVRGFDTAGNIAASSP
ncbi:MAG: putative Ig domain-containing protein [Leptospira sp.]|nr:putative Ig domain-containing protein [Leptospira sp.]